MSKACLLLSLPHELTCVCICRSTQKKHRVPVPFFSALPLTGPFAADVLFCSSLKNRCISEAYYSFGLLVLVPREILNYGDDEVAGGATPGNMLATWALGGGMASGVPKW